MDSDSRRLPAAPNDLAPCDVVRRDTLGTTLLDAVARALRQSPAEDPRGTPIEAPQQHPPQPAVPLDHLSWVDPEAVARWFVSRYGRNDYPALVLGSPHAAAAHLAVTLGAPWLPTSFDIAVEGPRHCADRPGIAVSHGRQAATALMSRRAEIRVCQLHDPLLHRASAMRAGRGGDALGSADTELTLRLRWCRLPEVYREFVNDRLLTGATVIVVRDVSRWPVVACGDRFTFHLGSRASGLAPTEYYRSGPALRDAMRDTGQQHDLSTMYAEGIGPYQDGEGEHAVTASLIDDLRWRVLAHGLHLRQVLYRNSAALSASVADLYRCWMDATESPHRAMFRWPGKPSVPRPGQRLVVESGRLFDPWQIVRTGSVPYWCEYPLASEATALELWLAGSEPFSAIDVLIDPPGAVLPGTAFLAQWHGIARFCQRAGAVDPTCASAYPMGNVPPNHLGTLLAGYPQAPLPPQLSAHSALRVMTNDGDHNGLLIF